MEYMDNLFLSEYLIRVVLILYKIHNLAITQYAFYL